MTAFLQSDEDCFKRKVDFQPIAQHAQSLPPQSNKCELASSDIQGSLISITFILDHLMICFHGLSSAEQNSEDIDCPSGIVNFTEILNSTLNKDAWFV